MSAYLINMYDFRVNPIVLDIRALFVSCGVQCWFRLRRGVITCVSVDCDEEDCEEGIYNNVQAVPGSSEDRRCLLDAICGAPTCVGLSSDFVLLGTAPLGHVARYRPERVMHQFSYVQCIPAHPIHSWVSYDDMDDTWTHYSDHLAAVGDLCVVPGQCAPDYIDWFFVISHSFMTTPQTDPPRDAYATQPNHIPHEEAPTSTYADPDVDEPRHAMVSVIIWLDVCHLLQLF